MDIGKIFKYNICILMTKKIFTQPPPLIIKYAIYYTVIRYYSNDSDDDSDDSDDDPDTSNDDSDDSPDDKDDSSALSSSSLTAISSSIITFPSFSLGKYSPLLKPFL